MPRTFLERPAVHRAEGYVPGEQPDNDEVIKLNTNENPYPPSPAVQRALSTFDTASLRRYPTPTASAFRALAGRIHDVRPEQIVATNGGDELLRLVLATFVDPGETIATASPCYSLYEVIAAIHGAEVSAIDLESDWSIPEHFADSCNQCGARAAFVVNPHAPSGKLSDVDTLSRIAANLDGVLVIDEAYLDFIDPEITYASVRLTERHDNVLILRTMSKGYSLAGLRFGYGIGSMPVIDPMQTKTKDSYNTDAVSQALATAALDDQDYARSTWARVRSERSRLQTGLNDMGLPSESSQANFLLVTVPTAMRLNASSLYEALKARNILVRYFAMPRLDDKLRISVGSPSENDALLSALRDLLG